MTDDLDLLLRDDLLQPPTDFAQRVMNNLPQKTLPVQNTPWHNSAWHNVTAQMQALPNLGQRLRWLAARAGWVGGGLLGFVLGLDQLAAFVFGVWLAGAAL